MASARAITFLADDPPIREDVHGWGLSRVNFRFVEALRDSLSVVACGSMGMYSVADLPLNLVEDTVMWGAQTRFERFKRRRLKAIYNDERQFQRQLPGIAGRVRDQESRYIFSPCGIDPKALRHAIELKRTSGVPLAVYLVDDFLEGALLSGDRVAHDLAATKVPEWLREVDRIFVISEGLQERVHALYGLDSIVLPLPYVVPKPNEPSAAGALKDQILFVGNLSHFYIDGLRDLVEILDGLQSDGTPMKLRFTTPTAEAARDTFGKHDFIECRQCPGPDELRKEIEASAATFAPYSFDEKYAVMVATSFPSKMLDYLSAARSVVTYGPAYSTSARYFSTNALETSITSRSLDVLRTKVLAARSAPSQSREYRRALAIHHDPAAIAGRIVSALLQAA